VANGIARSPDGARRGAFPGTRNRESSGRVPLNRLNWLEQLQQNMGNALSGAVSVETVVPPAHRRSAYPGALLQRGESGLSSAFREEFGAFPCRSYL